MSIPYIPLYVADYEADTSHLSMEEDGAYMRLLRLCWRTPGCSVPDDPKWIMRKMRVTADEFYRAVEPVIDEFFTRADGRIFQARLQREHASIEALQSKRSAAGKRGNEKRWGLKTNEKGSRKATDLRSQLEPEPEPLKREAKASPKRGSRLPSNWVLPSDWGQWALDEGYPENLIRSEAEKFRDYWIAVPGQRGVKLDWMATWRNWIRRNGIKVIKGGSHAKPSKQDERVAAFIAGARQT